MNRHFVLFQTLSPGLGGLVRWGSAAGLVLVACQKSNADGRAMPGPVLPERGETVVVETSAAQFIAGRVVVREGDRLRVQTAAEGPSIEARASEVYRLERAARISVGDLGICRIASDRWVGCRALSVTADGLRVNEASGEQHRIGANEYLAPSELTALNLQRHFARGADRQRHLREAEGAGQPRVPSDWRPRPNARVLASINGRWYSAKVRELAKDRVYVSWQAGERVTEVPRAAVVPEPAGEWVARRGSYALVRPSSPMLPWESVRVEAPISSERALIRDLSGERREVSVGDLVPLGSAE